eukprot:jgi/Picre1/28516/NNA_003920.t1
MSEEQRAYCNRFFPKIWSRFVTAVTESSHARGAWCGDEKGGFGCDGSPIPRPPTRLGKVDKIVAIGDVHGDVHKAKRAFKLAGLIDDKGSWVGGKTVAVQVGDVLDRGNNEVELYYWFERLQKQASRSGGALWARAHALGVALKSKCAPCSNKSIEMARMYMNTSAHEDVSASRRAALEPGGEFSQRFIAPNPVILAIGSTVFVHGGLLPHHAEYGIEKINHETQDWVLKREPVEGKPAFLSGRRAVVWARDYSHENEEYCDCDALKDALSKIPGAERMVVGHTIQGKGINSACEDTVYRVDVGLSKGCGDGIPEVLVIYNDSKVVKLREQERVDETDAEKRFHELETNLARCYMTMCNTLLRS